MMACKIWLFIVIMLVYVSSGRAVVEDVLNDHPIYFKLQQLDTFIKELEKPSINIFSELDLKEFKTKLATSLENYKNKTTTLTPLQKMKLWSNFVVMNYWKQVMMTLLAGTFSSVSFLPLGFMTITGGHIYYLLSGMLYMGMFDLGEKMLKKEQTTAFSKTSKNFVRNFTTALYAGASFPLTLGSMGLFLVDYAKNQKMEDIKAGESWGDMLKGLLGSGSEIKDFFLMKKGIRGEKGKVEEVYQNVMSMGIEDPVKMTLKLIRYHKQSDDSVSDVTIPMNIQGKEFDLKDSPGAAEIALKYFPALVNARRAMKQSAIFAH